MIAALKTACVALLIVGACFTSRFRSVLAPSSIAGSSKSLEAERVPADVATLGLPLGDFMRRAREVLKGTSPLVSLTEPERSSVKINADDIGAIVRQGAGLGALPANDEELFGVGVAPKETVAAALSIAVAKGSGEIRSIVLIWTSTPLSGGQAVTLFGTLVMTLTPLTTEQLIELVAKLKIQEEDFQPMATMQPISVGINNVVYQCVAIPISGATANACSAKPRRRVAAPQ